MTVLIDGVQVVDAHRVIDRLGDVGRTDGFVGRIRGQAVAGAICLTAKYFLPDVGLVHNEPSDVGRRLFMLKKGALYDLDADPM